MERNYHPLDSLFADYDSMQEGSLTFEDFAAMNEGTGVCMGKRDLNKIFNLIDRSKNGKVRIEDLKIISQLTMVQDDQDDKPSDDHESDIANLKGNELLARHKINDLYDEMKNKIESKNVTLE